MIATCDRCDRMKFVDNDSRLCETCTEELNEEHNQQEREPTEDMMIDAGLK